MKKTAHSKVLNDQARNVRWVDSIADMITKIEKKHKLNIININEIIFCLLVLFLHVGDRFGYPICIFKMSSIAQFIDRSDWVFPNACFNATNLEN